MAPACAAVVVHYRGAADTTACIQSLRQYAAATPILIVDNASPDGSGRAVGAAFADEPMVTVLSAGANLGFGGGCNLGIEEALRRWPGLRHVLLLNPDAVLTGGCLDALLATAARQPAAGLVGARILRPDGSVYYENGRLPRLTLSGFHRPAPAGNGDYEAGFVTGCCMLLDADLLRHGLRFHAPFFLYGEDADLCCEVRRRGRRLWVSRAALVLHRGGGSQRGERVLDEWTSDQVFFVQRAKAMLARRRLRWCERLVFLAVSLLAKPLAGVLTGRGLRWMGPYYRGLWAGLFS